MAHSYNPLAPLTPKQLRKQARAYVQAQFGPLLSQLNAEYARQADAGNAAINSSTQALARQLRGQAAQTHGIYAGAQAQQTAIDNALAAQLRGAGQQVQGDVGGQLAQAGQAPSPTNLGQIGAGAGATAAGMGSAALSRLVAEGAARENYSAGLPGIARLGGAQRAQDVALQLESGRQKDAAALRAKIPGLVAQIQQDQGNREFQKAAANLSFQGTLAGVSQRASSSAAGVSQRAKAASGSLAERQRHDVATENARIVANDIAKYRATHPRAGASGTGGLTPSQLQKTRSNAIEAVKGLKHGIANPNYDPSSTNYHNGIPDNQQWKDGYQPGKHNARQAYKYLLNHGISPTIADWAVGRVYGNWKGNPGAKSPH